MSLEALKAKADEFEKQRTALAKQMETEFKDAIQQIMATNEDIVGFRWCQYTPYFNDGDPCEFSVCGDIESKWIDSDPKGGDYEDGFDYPYDLPEDRRKVHDELESVVNLLPDDLMEKIFGDHTQITVERKDGQIVLTQEDYHHD